MCKLGDCIALKARVHNKNTKGECLMGKISNKITAYLKGYPSYFSRAKACTGSIGS